MPLSEKELQEEKDKFLRLEGFDPNRECLRTFASREAYNAAAKRGCVYIAKKSEETPHAYEKRIGASKDAFRECAKQLVRDFVEQRYNTSVSGDAHRENLEELAAQISAICPNILRNENENENENGRFRIGTTQKFVNLYLKYLWAGNKIPEPPHCPFDRIILVNKLRTQAKWTRMDNINEYEQWVDRWVDKVACLVAKNKQYSSITEWSIAEWELVEYNQQFPSGKKKSKKN